MACGCGQLISKRKFVDTKKMTTNKQGKVSFHTKLICIIPYPGYIIVVCACSSYIVVTGYKQTGRGNKYWHGIVLKKPQKF